MDKSLFTSFYLYKEHKQLVCSQPKRAFLQYKNFKLDLKSGKRINQGLEQFDQHLSRLNLGRSFEKPIVIHFFYEYGHSCVDLLELIDDNKPLAIYVEYEKADIRPIYDIATDKEDLSFSPLAWVSFEEYHNKFQRTYKHLLDGDCYQVNLTMPFYLRPNEQLTADEYISRLWSDPLKVGAYAHATYIDSLGKLYLSNSPECLFQIKQKGKKLKILTMPIKGTVEVNAEESRAEAWKKLISSEKDLAELDMITDLMRNDLTHVTEECSKVLYKQYPLNVPGLIHQFSVVESEIKKQLSVYDIFKGLFPGGSITGVPKKNVCRLINEIEKYNRGFYCGSSLLLFKNLKTASINIRSSEIDFVQDEVKYGSGGGITLLSQSQIEYDEALAKLKSFLLLLS